MVGLQSRQGLTEKQDGKWKNVCRKQTRSSNGRSSNGRWNIMKIGKGNERGPSTTYYFFDFEEGRCAKDLSFEFKELGVIEEIVIPAKKDWRRKKYGFVRFVNVYEERAVETKLNNIWLNGKKIIDNLLKYKRKELTKPSRNGGGIKN